MDRMNWQYIYGIERKFIYGEPIHSYSYYTIIKVRNQLKGEQ